ncbi:nucleoside diphosphate kinase 7 [Wyeomyia smithii]|uniref:nucleoside diphosphate kinase 7 n=1 Tax=Wyeomyia smithii TaxID=174621 RepID=UPI002467C3C4|nr:nucleoside diphosphate kinase 7 [Wyeomyia smithii]
MFKPEQKYFWKLNKLAFDEYGVKRWKECIPMEPFVAIELTGVDAHHRFNVLCGSDAVGQDKYSTPDSLQALYGNNIYSSTSDKETEFIFDSSDVRFCLRSTALLQNSTLCIIKPHIVQDSKTDFNAKTRQMSKHIKIPWIPIKINMGRPVKMIRVGVQDAARTRQQSMIMEMISGKCVALEITNKNNDGSDTICWRFRDFCGPICPSVARIIRPQSLRARFGINKIMNAVYCTDLEENAEFELEYIFKFLS